MSSFTKITQDKLGISEPNPRYFGNSENPTNDPNWTNKNWLKSRFHFNFAEWNQGPQNFGVLRVLNDDLVQPNRGFGTHGHRDAEICTYVLDGELTHQDSMGTKESLGRGSIQFMTAGSGVSHSERNESGDKPLRFIQMWLTPRRRGLTPNYGSLVADATCNQSRLNQFAWLVADVENKDNSSKVPIHINTDANIYAAELDGSKQIEFKIEEGRAAYIVQLEGSAIFDDENESIEKTKLDRHEAARVYGPITLRIEANKDSEKDQNPHILLVEVESPK